MTKDELIQGIHQQIVRYAENETLLNRTLSFVSDLADSIDKEPEIKNDEIAEIIKENHDLVVPIVCDDMFEYITPDNKVISIRDYICDLYTNTKTISAIEAIKSNYYYGITLLERIRTGSDGSMSNSIYNKIKEAVDSNRIRLKTSIRQFLIKGNFPVIVTTFGFPVIEKELGLDIEDAPVWYNPCGRNDLPFVLPESTKVYHIFGGESHTCWVYNEQTLLRFVHSLHSGDYGAKNLSNFLRKHGSEDAKRLLVLGSSLPDWLFRFFIYPMYEDEIKDVYGYWLSLDTIEKGLDLFLDRNHYKGQTNLRVGNRIETIIEDATNLKSNNVSLSNGKSHKTPSVFISYKRPQTKDEYDKFKRVEEILKRQVHGNIWIDYKEVADGGNPYWANIKNAVQNCDIFFLLITERYLNDYQNVVNIEELYHEKDLLDAVENDARDDIVIQSLPPVVREAFYAIYYKKKCVPIVIPDELGKLSGAALEAISRNSEDNRNLPRYIFNEHTYNVYDDNNPNFFKFTF